jgi:phosphatidylserine decarboxylase
MTIHREGYLTIGVTVVVLFFVNLLSARLFPGNLPVAYGLLVFSILFFLLIVHFFRHPSVAVVENDKQVLAPADGKVVVVERTEESEFLKDDRIQISIFMSPVNVHVNRNPISGVVRYMRYHPGKYLVAWHPKSSTDNERTSIVVQNIHGSFMIRQIAGALARRICWYVAEGDQVKQGREFGFIKFGSRVDVFLPLHANIKVQMGQVTKAGQTVLATFD